MTRTSSADTRLRIVTATAELFRRQGFNGTSLSQIVKTSGATTGSLYHFFPGGKNELAAVVLRETGQAYGELVEIIVSAAVDPAVGFSDAFAGAAQLMLDTDFIDPCPIGTVAREVASTHEELRKVAAEVMQGWVDIVTRLLIHGGITKPRAEQLAIMAVASIEGGFVLARTHRDVAPFLAVGESLRETIAREIAANSSET